MNENTVIADVYKEANALRVKEGSTGVIETGAIADANTVGQAPVIHRVAVADAAGDTDVTLEHKTRVIDVWAVKVGGDGSTGGDTVQVKNGANAITDAISLGVSDKDIARASQIDDAYHEIAAGGTLRVTAAKDSDCQCVVYVQGIRVT